MATPSRQEPPVHRDIVVIGGSAGGIEALRQVVAGLPSNLNAAVFVVIHVSPEAPSRIAEILSRCTKLPVQSAVHGEAIRPGRILVAPSDNHLTLEKKFVRVVRGPKDNGHRPAVDPLFHTAARTFGPRVIGVIISGTMSCGTQGMVSIQRKGGLTVVQDPAEALFSDMPNSALAHVKADHICSAQDMGPLIAQLVTTQVSGQEVAAMTEREEIEDAGTQLAEITCPECNGSMTESETGGFLRFRCHVGHSFSLDSLVSEQSAALEAALWAAIRSLEESAGMSRRIAARSDVQMAKRFEEKSAALLQHAEVLKGIVMSDNLITQMDAAFAHSAENKTAAQPAGKELAAQVERDSSSRGTAPRRH